jgi:carbonic anhydrase
MQFVAFRSKQTCFGFFSATLAAVVFCAGLWGCASSPSTTTPSAAADDSALVSATMTQSEQAAITPDEALDRLVKGNERFVSGQSFHRDYVAQRGATASGQYPFAIVLSCLDSRSNPEIVFDQGIGDIFVARVAGNYATTDIIGSMEFGAKVAGAKLIVVMGHTECGAIKGACDNVELGNLTTVIQALRPAVDEVQGYTDDRSSANKKFVYAVTLANVRRTVAHIRAQSPILHDMETSGQIKIVGAMQDIASGVVTFYPWSENEAGPAAVAQ